MQLLALPELVVLLAVGPRREPPEVQLASTVVDGRWLARSLLATGAMQLTFLVTEM